MSGTDTNQDVLTQKIADHFLAGGTLGDLQGFTDQDYEALYTIGHGMYSQERYDDALKIFGFLVMNNPFDRRFHQAMASALQMRGDFSEAIGYYSMASVMDIKDPVPTFHTAECLAALGQIEQAREALAIVLEQSATPEFADLKARAQGLIALLDRHAAKGA